MYSCLTLKGKKKNYNVTRGVPMPQCCEFARVKEKKNIEPDRISEK